MKTVREWINTVDINMLDESHMNYTPLIIAVTKNNKDLVELLLDNRADPNFAVDDTALILASQNGYIDIVRILLEKGADPNRPNGNRITPIISAAYNGHVAVMQALLDRGADPNVVSHSGYTALLFAVENNRIEAVRTLLSKGVNVNVKRGNNASLHIAAKKGYKEIVELLLAAGADKDAEGQIGSTPLALATEYIKPEVVKVLLEAGADPNKKNIYGEIPLVLAFRSVNPVIAELLLKAGGNPNMVIGANSAPIILLAAERRDDTFLDLLLAAGVDVNKTNTQGMTALIIAVNNNYISKIEKLLAAGADPNKQTVRDRGFALLYASQRNLEKEIELLLEHGADVNLQDGVGNTALIIAADNNSIPIIEKLLAAGADPNKQTVRGKGFALLSASQRKSPRGIELLLEHGADVNLQNNAGNTALFMSAEAGDVDSVKLLLAKNPAPTDKIKRALKRRAFKPEILALLKEKYSQTSTPWKGFTRSDIQKLDTIFDESLARNFSYCPICLAYVERSEACNYMSHNCSTGNYYHAGLYDKYKNIEGFIKWCTICGRICVGHLHYPIVTADAPKPEPLVMPHQDPFERDCRMTSGGGGLPEKLARFKGLRKTALELQTEIGKMEEDIAMDKLVEASWNAALPEFRPNISNMSKPANWNNNTKKFLPNVATTAPTSNANDPTKYSAPVILSPGTGTAQEGRNANYEGNYITGEVDVPVMVFKHKNKDGNERVHPQIGKEMLLDFLDGAGERLGKCFDGSCGGLLYPREIELAFADPKIAPTITDDDRARLAKYKERFGRWHAKGGRRRTKRARSAQRSAHRTLHSKSHVSKRTRRIKRSHK